MIQTGAPAKEYTNALLQMVQYQCISGVKSIQCHNK